MSPSSHGLTPNTLFLSLGIVGSNGLSQLKPIRLPTPSTDNMKSAHHAAIIARLALLALVVGSASAAAQNTSRESAFSFAVYGDSRSMMYLPYKQSQEAEARDLMTDM